MAIKLELRRVFWANVMNSKLTHNDAIARALLTASKMGAMVARREVGLFYDERGYPRKVGIKGEADVQGIMKGGRALAIEIKVDKDTRKPQQEAWAKRFEELGGLYVLARYRGNENGDETIAAAIAGSQQ